jgi:hypothetical protein
MLAMLNKDDLVIGLIRLEDSEAAGKLSQDCRLIIEPIESR